ncbi:DASH family cryptochrome [Psychrobacter sp. FBL11]|uniref:Cryptochrome DASH n=1 Tax=Psychrobacter saeujeotis TaxID=3143436 RepID=A0ABU9XAX7_9GAMM|nr:DASH family cryptochrome [uncultured Psychrobacter sp.]
MSSQTLNKKTVLMLFHNDIRVHDNETLITAAQLASSHEDGTLILVYVSFLAASLTKSNWGPAYCFDEMGFARQQFLQESLIDLNQSLARLGNRLLYLKPDNHPKELDTFKQLCQLIEAQQVTDICISATADYAQNQAYDVLQDKYPKVRWHVLSTATLFNQLPTDDLPKSFTQFRKKVETDNNLLEAEDDLVTFQTPNKLPPLPQALNSNNYALSIKIADKSIQLDSNFVGGEGQAVAHLNAYFESDAPSSYKITRNALDTWTHSTKFSAWLANGSLSVKTLLNRLRHYERDTIANESTYWIWFELLWREYFYWYANIHQQKLFLFQGIGAYKPSTQYHKKRLQQWQNGETAYPIVNACMKQLKATGYMSNRGRQLVASCLIHELGVDWRYGATHFEQYLIDYDVASNWGNWQYLAGVGADPRGCRQFNLDKQTQQYDPQGDFINKWQGSKATK